MNRTAKLALATMILTIVASSSFAATVPSTNNNNVSAAVAGSCQWTTPLTMTFPSYDPFAGSATTQTTSVTFKCVKKTAAGDVYKVWFSKTAGNMIVGGENLAYTLTDGSNAPLATTSGGAATVGGIAGVSGAGYTYTVNGSIAAGQDVSVGTYVDTVIARIEY